MNDPPRQPAQAGIPRPVASLALLYAGILIGVSFIATPAKFLARSITLAQALDVGRWTFGIFGWVELGLIAGLLMLGLRSRSVRVWWPILAVLALVALQALFLRPMLDARLAEILSGGDPPPSQLHNVYGVVEVAKLAALLCIGWARPPKPAIRASE